MVDRCVCCGEIVPEGRMVCPNCMVTVKQDSFQAYENGYRSGYEAGRRSVGRKSGRWENITGGMVMLGDCSECKVRQPVICTNYCKNCGADMRGEEE